MLGLRFRASAFTSIPPTTEATSQVPLTADLGHGVRMDFVQINPGQFMMGCSPGDAECYPLEELPVHPVRITRGFQIGKYQVTQEQWQAVLGSSPSFFQRCYAASRDGLLE